MSQITALCDKIIAEHDVIVDCETTYRLARALKKYKSYIDEGHDSAIKHQRSQGHIHDPEWCYVCSLNKEIEEIFK